MIYVLPTDTRDPLMMTWLRRLPHIKAAETGLNTAIVRKSDKGKVKMP